jgi:hypothetical protein
MEKKTMSENDEGSLPVTAGSELNEGLGAIIGKWPGNETDEEIMEALDGLNPENKLRGALEKIAKFRDSNDCPCICWGYSAGIENKCPMCIAREALGVDA